jgi:Tol biopolymer transport system component
VATRKSRRVSNAGTGNPNPPWSNDGRLAWASKRAGGTCIVATPPGGGEPVAVTKPGTWEHPAWSRDNRHLVAQMGGAVFIVDGALKEEDRDAPVRIFNNAGNWMSPDWRK